MVIVSRLRRLIALGIAGFAAACTVQQTEIPGLVGPSELALSVSVTATPDTMNRDGASQASVAVTVHGPNGQPLPNVPVRLDVAVNGVLIDTLGTVAAKNLVTGSDGRATTIFTAPPPPPPGSPIPTCFQPQFSPVCDVVTITATPVGSNYQTANTQSAEIRLTPVGIILPPTQSGGARFTFSPEDPEVMSPVQFNGLPSCPGPTDSESGLCQIGHGTIVDYRWDFGDGKTAQGPLVSHTFEDPGTYGVILTVTTDRGASGSTIQFVQVSAGEAPTADFVFSPSAPLIGQDVQFNASASRAAAGRTIVDYIWNWGDGEDGSGRLEDHDYQAAGVYTVTLTVVDNAGQEGTVAKIVTVGSGNPTASFTISPESPGVAPEEVTFDASASEAAPGSVIEHYSWSFGDGETSNAGPIVEHPYDDPGTYTVTLTVTDDENRKNVVSQSVTIEP